MKNLRRALCLALACVMLLGMMVMTASAAGFTDSDEIVHTEAVSTMNALNIINGKEDGSYFDPAGTVTRAEMAKMICVALNGGRDPQLGTTAYSFADTAGHWAAGYIEYCYNLGIIAGRGDGTFDPNGTVTGTEAAKMLLVSIGYDADAEGFTGASWAIGVNVHANQKDLYDELGSLNPSAGLNRDNAAQMVYNAINATRVEYEYKLVTVNGTLTTVAVVKDVVAPAPLTIVADKFKLITEYGYMTGISHSAATGKYTYTFASAAGTFGGPAITVSPTGAAAFDCKTDYSDLFGMKVKVMYKSVGGTTTVYGMYAEDSAVLLSGVAGRLPAIGAADTSFKYAGVSHKIDSGAISVYDYNTAAAAALSGYKAASPEAESFKLIDNDGDNKADCAISHPFTVAKVTFVGSSSVTIGNVSYKISDCDIYDGIAKNDYAVITPATNTANGRVSIAKTDTVSGTCDALESASKLMVGGAWYSNVTGKTGDAYALGSSFSLVIVNGYVYHATKITSAAAASNVCLITAKDDAALNTIDATASIQLLFADGAKKVVKVSKVDTAVPGTLAAVSNAAGANAVGAAGTLYTYAVNADGNYELRQITAADYDASTLDTGAVTITEGRASNGYRFADDAVIFYYTGTDYKATTGAVVNTWATVTSAAAGAGVDDSYYADTRNGFRYVALAYIKLSAPPSVDGDTSYGWITAAPALIKEGSDYYIQTTLWNGAESVTCRVKSTAANPSISSSTNLSADANVAEGTPVSFKDIGNGQISTVTSLAASADAVTAYADGGSEILFETQAAYKLTADTRYIYVDTHNNTGVPGGAVSIATRTLLGTYVKNCYVVAAASDAAKVAVLIVDTANDIAENASCTPATGALITALDASAGTCSVTDAGGASSYTGTLVAAEAAGWAGVAAVDVVAGITDSTAVTAADVAAGNVLRVVAQDGTYYYFVITVV